MMMRMMTILLALAAAAATVSAQQVQDFARISGQGRSIIQGIGLVMGLNNTGDSGKELATARPLMQVLQNAGVPITTVRDIEKSSAIALVMVTCEIPEAGARRWNLQESQGRPPLPRPTPRPLQGRSHALGHGRRPHRTR
jgi:flagellar P-ring protein FlgI